MVKGKCYKIIVRPAILHGIESWTTTRVPTQDVCLVWVGYEDITYSRYKEVSRYEGWHKI